MLPRRVRFTDGKTRNVYTDEKGEFVVDDNGERVYGQWAHPDAPPRRSLLLTLLVFLAGVVCAGVVSSWLQHSPTQSLPQQRRDILSDEELDLEILREERRHKGEDFP